MAPDLTDPELRIAEASTAIWCSRLVEYLRDLNELSTTEAILHTTIQTAAEVTGATRAILLLATDGGANLTWGAAYGTDDILATPPSLRIASALVQSAKRSKDFILADRSVADPSLSALLETYGGGYSCVLAPLNRNDNLLGLLVLAFERAVPRELAGDAQLGLFLQQASYAIEKVLAHAEMRQKVDRLSAVVALDDAITNAPGFDETLAHIIHQVKQLTDAEQASLWLYDPETDELALQMPTRVRQEFARLFRIPLSGDYTSAHIFRTGQPRLCNDLANEPDPSKYFVRLAGSRNTISVPLDVDQRRIGVFHVLNKRSGNFTESDLDLVCLLASHVAALIESALLVEQQRKTVSRLRELNEVVDQERGALERTLAVHDELTRLVLDGQGVTGISSALSKLLDNPVAVDDRFFNLLAYNAPNEEEDLETSRHSGIAEGGMSAAISTDPALRAALTQSGGRRRPTRMAPLPHIGLDHPWVVAPIVVGAEIMGFVYVLENNHSLDDLGFMALERAAMAMALVLMKEKAAVEAQYKLRGDLVVELLSGDYGAEEKLLERAVYLGLDLRTPRTVLVIDIDDFADFVEGLRAEDKVQGLKQKLRDVVERVCTRHLPEAVVTGRSDEVIVLAKVGAEACSGKVPRINWVADTLRAEVCRWLPEVTVSVGIGSECRHLADYRQSYQQARSALQVVKALRQRDRTIAFSDLAIYGLLFDPHNRPALISFVEGTIGTLLAYDRTHAMHLSETLHQYLLHDCRLEETAEKLNVHVNTLRYRLRRVKQITKIELDNTGTRCNLYLALNVVHGLDLNSRG